MQCVWCQETTVATSGCRSFGDIARGVWSLLWVSEGRWRASIDRLEGGERRGSGGLGEGGGEGAATATVGLV